MISKGPINRLSCLLQLGVLLLTGAAAHSAEIPESVKNIVRERVEAGKTIGMVIGVVDTEGISYFGYGKTAASSDQVPNKDTVFEIGSITKVFTAILLADAVKRGEVNYDDTIDVHLPKDVEVRVKNGIPITLENLSVQNSGLPRMPSNFRPTDPTNPYADYTIEDMYKALSRMRMRRDAGESYEYSNLGVGLLGHLLSRASDQSYEELILNRIADPLGMSDSKITLSKGMQERLAKGHADGKEVANWDLPTFAGAGALRSTAQDMILFLQANTGLHDTPLLATMRETHAPKAEAGSEFMEIGLGWHVLTSKEGPMITWHNGGTGGYRCFAGFVHDPPIGVVVLTNSGGAGDDDIGFHLLNDTIPMAGAIKRTEVTIDSSILKRYVGKYQLRSDLPSTILDISLRGNQLLAQLTGQEQFPVFPESETSFFFKIVDAQLEFETDNNSVTAVILHQGGQVIKAKRIQ